MSQAGPSKIQKHKKKKSGAKDGVRTSKIKKVEEIQSIAALEELATNFVSNANASPFSHDFINAARTLLVGSASRSTGLCRFAYIEPNEARCVQMN